MRKSDVSSVFIGVGRWLDHSYSRFACQFVPYQYRSKRKCGYHTHVVDSEQGEITQLLARWAQGDSGVVEALAPLVYDRLRAIAEAYLRNERARLPPAPRARVRHRPPPKHPIELPEPAGRNHGCRTPAAS